MADNNDNDLFDVLARAPHSFAKALVRACRITGMAEEDIVGELLDYIAGMGGATGSLHRTIAELRSTVAWLEQEVLHNHD